VTRRTSRRGWSRLRIAGLGLLAAGIAASGIALWVIARSPIPAAAWLRHPVASWMLSWGENPYLVQLVRPPTAPLSEMAELGRDIFFDPSLSASGRLSCASCHRPRHFYGPPGGLSAMLGGPDLASQGVRAVPSLTYLERQPNFSIGPDNEENETVNLTQMVSQGQNAARTQKTAQDTAATAANLVPQGGLFWDGRVDTLQAQAMFPLLSSFEMDGGNIDRVAAKLRQAPYAPRFEQLFGPAIFADPRFVVTEAMFAVARYQIEDQHFHPYTSKYDYWLEGKARLDPAELRGYLLFNNPQNADCGGCHLDQPSPDGLPPLFTDHQYEALGVPRNQALAANRDPSYFDLGICGPYRTNMRSALEYCGLFATPTLRNVATRQVFFHNGVYHTLQQVLDFYDFRDTDPAKIYPRAADGRIEKYDDLPRRYRADIDITDPPFDRKFGGPPAMTAADERDIIAFLKTLTDGWHP
jgi:cytochrome c peroxidase